MSEKITLEPVPVLQRSLQADSPHFSPDGEWIVFYSLGKQEDLWLVKTDGSGLRQLTDDPHRDRFPRWSPDGKRIAFQSDRSGKFEFWTITPDGSGLERLTDTPGPEIYYPIWSPDGRQIAYRSSAGTAFIMDVPAPGSKEVAAYHPLPPMPEPTDSFRVRSWSPDGQKLAGHSLHKDGRDAGVVVYAITSRSYEIVAPRGASPEWLPDSRRLLFMALAGRRQTAEDERIYLLDTRTKKAREFLSVAPHTLRPVTISRDGRRICFPMQMAEAHIWLLSAGAP